jgi:hypothetical protein
MLALTTIVFGLAWWLGLYLLVRDPRNPLLRRAGLGLLIYALALAADLLRPLVSAPLLLSAISALAFIPAICWVGAAICLLPETPRRALLDALLIDRLAFAREPQLQAARANLRANADALPRIAAAQDLAELEPAEFARLTRRALSHYGDLPRLAASPLTRLPQISARLHARGAADQPIERAVELQALLGEAIGRCCIIEPLGYTLRQERGAR